MTPTVSIIVPVYNAEKTIGRCIESILNQEYTDFELILIDDGSTDGSSILCDVYAEKDERIRVVHKENSGVSDSRNMALDMAQGTYLQFLDADDWITPNATRAFVETAIGANADMVISDFYRVVDRRISQKGSIDEEGILTRCEFAEQMMENPADFYYGVLWNKFYKREIVEKYRLRMDKDISWCEDFMFNLEYLRHANYIYVIQLPLYYYVKTKGSLATQGMNISKTIKMKLMVFEYYNDFYKHVLDEEDYEKNRLQVYRFLLDAASDGAVPPSILPGTKKLGEERITTSSAMIENDGILMDHYRDRKLMDYYLEPIAIRHELELTDLKVLWGLTHFNTAESKDDLADSLGMSPRLYSASLQKLAQKKLIKIKRKRKPKGIIVSFLEDADVILPEIALSEHNYQKAMFQDFTEEEIMLYQKLDEKKKANIRKVL